MKFICILLSCFVAGCSTCNVPLGNYSSQTASEYEISIDLASKAYFLKHETWSPSNYENRSVIAINGAWSCMGNTAKFNFGSILHTATYQIIGINPLGLPANTKALVFEVSDKSVLSEEILYPSSALN